MLKNIAIWSVVAVSIFVGSLSSAVLIFMIRYNDWGLLPYVSGHKLRFLLTGLPYFWLLSIILLAVVGFYNLKHTKKGYRYSVLIVVAVTVGGSILLGAVFHSVGWGQAIDNKLSDSVPLYRDHLDPRRQLWNSADRGFLAGTIITFGSGQVFTLRSVDGLEWQVEYSRARIIGPTELEVDMPVKIIGKRQAELMIQAALIQAMLRPNSRWLMPPHGPMMMPGACESAACSFPEN